MLQIKKIIRVETRNLFFGKRPVALVFLIPLIFCILFGAIYAENTVRHIPMIIFDQDQSFLSRQLIQAYSDSNRYRIISYVNTQNQMEDMLRNGKASVALEIPADFSKNVKIGKSTHIVMLFNSANNVIANSAISSSQEINRAFSLGIAQKLTEATNILPSSAINMVYPVHFKVRILNNPVTGYTSFMLPGIVLNGVQVALLLSVSPLLAYACRHRKYDRSYSSMLLMLGKSVPYWIMGTISYAVSLAGLAYMWAVPLRGSIVQLLILGSVFVFFVIQVLYVFSAICPDEMFAMQLPLIYIMPGLLFCGISWPVFSMRGFGKIYSSIMPMTYAADTMRDLMLQGYAPFFFRDIVSMIIGSIVAGILAWSIFAIRRKITWKRREHQL